jgi:phosphatidylinositol-3-phosphatase
MADFSARSILEVRSELEGLNVHRNLRIGSSGYQNRLRAIAVVLVLGSVARPCSAASIGDVFVIAFENHNLTQPSGSLDTPQLLGNPAAPFLNSLLTPGNPNAAQTSYAANYYSVGLNVHPSQLNYTWSEAGSSLGDNVGSNFSVPHLTSLLNAAGVAWNNYQEDVQYSSSPLMSASGRSTILNPYYGTGQYNYAANHNPMSLFSDTATQNVFPLTQLAADFTNHTVGRYNWITPNEFNDMHSALTSNFIYQGTVYFAGSQQEKIALGDNFLSILIPQIEATPEYKNNGAIVIWFDETEGGDTTDYTMPEIVISPLAKGNAYASTVSLNHSSDLRTMQEIFNAGSSFLGNPIPPDQVNLTGGYNTVAAVNDLGDLFQPGTLPVRGDFNRDGHFDSADITAMLAALADLNVYKTTGNLSGIALLAIGDVNGDGVVNNADLPALLDLLKSGGNSPIGVPEPAAIVYLSSGGLILFRAYNKMALKMP